MDINISGNTLQLNEFDINSLIFDELGDYIHPRICIIAPSNSGKSWIVKNIMYVMKDIPTCVVIAPTDKMNKFYDNFIPTSYIYHEYKQEIIPRILTRQKKIIEKNERRTKENKKLIDPRICFIMDDCLSSKASWTKEESILEILFQGRHYKMSYILTLQYCMGIQPEMRTQFNYIFLLGEDNQNSRKKLYEHWCGVVPSYSMFETIFSQVTTNYGCLVVNNRIKSTDLTKKLFWFRAKKMPNFKIGIPQFVKFHDENYDPNYLNKNKLFDVTSFNSKKKTNIIVKLVK